MAPSGPAPVPTVDFLWAALERRREEHERAASEACTEVVVCSLSGASCTVTADRAWTVRQLKRAVAAAIGVPPSQQRLLCGTAELEDESLLSVFGDDVPGLTLVRRPLQQASWLAEVEANGLRLEGAPRELRADREVVLAAVREDDRALQFAAEEFRADRGVVLAAVLKRGEALQYAHEDLRADRGVVLYAVAQSGMALQFAARRLREDRELVLAAVANAGQALQFAGEALRADREVVLQASRSSGHAIKHAAQQLRAHKERDGS